MAQEKTWRKIGHPGCMDAPAVIRPTASDLAEFELLDAAAPLDDEGRPAWSFEGEPLTERERRWLELYCKVEKWREASKAFERRR
jgi:hypothetical protein